MTRKLLATVLAASIALTSVSVTPAQANEKDVAKVLGGLALIYLVTRAAKRHERRRAPAPTPVVVQPQIPGFCLQTYNTPQGRQQYFNAHCLRQNAPQVALPRQCKTRIWSEQGRRNVYGPNCLTSKGYRIAYR